MITIARSVFKVVLLNSAREIKNYLGTAFPFGSSGNLLTCRHVIDFESSPGDMLAVVDGSGVPRVLSEQPRFSDSKLDLALLPGVFSQHEVDARPVLTPSTLKIGEDVYSYGYFAIGGDTNSLEAGYFGGKIVNFVDVENDARFTLPFAVLEGMSGSPVMTYHNGVKIIGIATGNRASRIQATEVVEVKNDGEYFKETVNRIVEFGVSYHPRTLVRFAKEMELTDVLVTAKRQELS